MPDERVTLNAHVMALIGKIGGYDAAVAVFEARWGKPYSKGTITAKKNGTLDWTVMDVMALEEAAGSDAITRWLASRHEEDVAADCVPTELATFARESGEAISAVINARTPAERAKAVKELNDVSASVDRLTDAFEARA